MTGKHRLPGMADKDSRASLHYALPALLGHPRHRASWPVEPEVEVETLPDYDDRVTFNTLD